jgi:hypothetical protein
MVGHSHAARPVTPGLEVGGVGGETFGGFGKVADFAKTHQKIGDRFLRA